MASGGNEEYLLNTRDKILRQTANRCSVFQRYRHMTVLRSQIISATRVAYRRQGYRIDCFPSGPVCSKFAAASTVVMKVLY